MHASERPASSEIRPRHAIGRRALAARPQQERQHQAEGERDVEQGLLIGSVGRQPGVDVVDGHCDRHHADDEACVAGELAHWSPYFLSNPASR